MQTQQPTVAIPADLFNALALYLRRQPWEEVQPLMAGMSQAVQAAQTERAQPDKEA